MIRRHSVHGCCRDVKLTVAYVRNSLSQISDIYFVLPRPPHHQDGLPNKAEEDHIQGIAVTEYLHINRLVDAVLRFLILEYWIHRIYWMCVCLNLHGLNIFLHRWVKVLSCNKSAIWLGCHLVHNIHSMWCELQSQMIHTEKWPSNGNFCLNNISFC